MFRPWLVGLLLLCVPLAVRAQPVIGSYHLLAGQLSQSWTGPHRPDNGQNSVLNTGSGNSTNFGTQWSISCAVQTLPATDSGGINIWGNGCRVYQAQLSGGRFNLAPGPWGSGQGSVTTVQVVDSVIIWSNLVQYHLFNLQVEGTFDQGQGLLHLAIVSALGFSTDEVIGGGYPPFLDLACQPTGLYGCCADVHNLTLTIDGPVPTRSVSWGQLKARYR